MYLTKRQQLESLRAQLEQERSSFLSHWKELSEYILPRRPRFAVTDTNKGDRRSQKIVDSTATLSARTLRSGMMSGITSPARPWFRLVTPVPELNEQGEVKEWLHTCVERMNTVFIRSNLYNVLPIIYGDMGVYGTSAMQCEEDFEDVVRFYAHPIGSYSLGTSDKQRVNVFFRDFRMTVRQLIEKFAMDRETGAIDWSKVSEYVHNAWNLGQTETWIEISHCIKPNDEWNPKAIDSKYKKFVSCYFERGTASAQNGTYLGPADADKFLSEKGYDYFPVLCPRWEVTGEDVYGTNCPGMEALGDIKQLMIGERRIMQAVEKIINPPMVGPTSLRNSKATILPGDITWLDVREGQQGFRPAHEVNFRINEMEQKQAQVRQRISRTFFEDLFLMLSNSDRREITAREVDERHEEKLLALGPVLEQLNQDLLDPLIDFTFDMMNRQGIIPPPPEAIQGMPLRVDYQSIMAQAQKSIGIGTIERFAGFVGNVAAVAPGILDKVDADQMIDVYGDTLSLAPSIIRTDDQVQELRQQRAQAQQQQVQSEQIQQQAKAAKDLSQSSMEGNSLLTELVNRAKAGQLA